jgi:hypothetical protein
LTCEASKRKRGRPPGSFKKPRRAADIIERLPSLDRIFFKETAEGDLYPAREHKVVDRAFVAIEEKTGIIVSGDAKLLLYAAHQSLVTWFIYDRGLAGLYGLPSTRGAGMTKNKRRAEIFKYLKFAFEKSTGKTAPASCNKNGCPFSRFAHTALAIIAPPKFAPPSEKALAKAIENALAPLKKRLGPLAGLVCFSVKFPNAN